MAASQFNSPATLLPDGSVTVEGSLDNDPAAMLSDVEFRFLLVQGDVVVQGKGRGSAGIWTGTAPAGQGTLSEGDAGGDRAGVRRQANPARLRALQLVRPDPPGAVAGRSLRQQRAGSLLITALAIQGAWLRSRHPPD
jgi:hypothetical protein